jgi:hypothetical protein
MRWRSRPAETVDEENPYWMSFSDIMSALLVIFILASVILILKLMEIEKELKQRRVQFEQEIVELKDAALDTRRGGRGASPERHQGRGQRKPHGTQHSQ